MISLDAVQARGQAGEYVDNPIALWGDALSFYAEIDPTSPGAELAIALSGMCAAIQDREDAVRAREQIQQNHQPLITEALSRLWSTLASTQTPEAETKFHTMLRNSDDTWLAKLGTFRVSHLSEIEKQAFDELTLTANRKIGRKYALPEEEVQRIVEARATFFETIGLGEQWATRLRKKFPSLVPPYNVIGNTRVLMTEGIDVETVLKKDKKIKVVARTPEAITQTIRVMEAHASKSAVAKAIERNTDLFNVGPARLADHMEFLIGAGIDIDAVCRSAPSILPYPKETLQSRLETIFSLAFGIKCDAETVRAFINFWPGIIGTSDAKLEFLNQLGQYASNQPDGMKDFNFGHLKRASILPLGRLLRSIDDIIRNGGDIGLAQITRRASLRDFKSVKDSPDIVDGLHTDVPIALIDAYNEYLLVKNSRQRTSPQVKA